MDKKLLLVFVLLFGVIYKLVITSQGDFIFNIDNARDLIDVREMVVLHKLRLIGPTSGIEGFYNGPGWYYLLVIPFVISAGNPYSGIILMIFLWMVGGYFLLRISSRFGLVVMATVGVLWVASNYVTLATVYSFNPNPVILLTPLFIYLMERFLIKPSLSISIWIWLLAGLFFNFEMAFGIFMPLIILAILLVRKSRIFSREVVIGLIVFVLTLLPQVFFNFRHQLLFLTSLAKNFSTHAAVNYSQRPGEISNLYISVLEATLMNWSVFSELFLYSLLILFVLLIADKKLRRDNLLSILLALILIPFIGSIILPLNFLPWHLGGTMAAVIILIGFLLNQLLNMKRFRFLAIFFSLVIIIYGLNNLELVKNFLSKPRSDDPSVFRNEIAAIDFVYYTVNGQNFRVYSFLPSVIDYPYQYLFWWWGQGKYGYLPEDYAYLPNKPPYISNKEKFSNGSNPRDSGLIFLIKEPNRPDLKDLWENNFKNMAIVSKQNIGPLEVEIKK